ncbi:MAG TPA: malto-oligosyltrehalose synthase [Actinomycetota bacterium]|nr:malto-oligosyltrehalose synthase [Actinomycetota bacterium]
MSRDTPVATYRLQLGPDLTFARVRAILPYLERLGVSHLYLSPITEARPGSTHGYDVTDPGAIRKALGGEEGFRKLAAAARKHGLRILLDIVPNHVAASPDNPWWEDLLVNGIDAESAFRFDLDLERAADAVVLPVLKHPLERELRARTIKVTTAGGAVRVRYGDLALPTAPRTWTILFERNGSGLRRRPGEDRLRAFLDAQPWRLASWRGGDRKIVYRRFFDITDLAGVRVEDPRVFDDVLGLAIRLVRDGLVDGLRLDHIDGLRDPAAALRRLRGALGSDAWILIEKILEADEPIRAGWPVDGTTGYEFLNALNGVFVDRAGFEALRTDWMRRTGDRTPFEQIVHDGKRNALETLFPAEAETLAGLLRSLDDSIDEESYAGAVVAVTVHLPVYRTYVASTHPETEDRRLIERAVRHARGEADAAALRVLRAALLLEHGGSMRVQRDLVARWQQLSGPAMAKGLEDTALYRHAPLASLNEVGGRADVATDLAFFSRFNAARLHTHPLSLAATSTHDTKRGEDVRARLNVLSEIPEEWTRLLDRWERRHRRFVGNAGEHESPDAAERILLYQTIVGAWPLRGSRQRLAARVADYARKAAREAKRHSSWRKPDHKHERALRRWVQAVVADDVFARDVDRLLRIVGLHGAIGSLAQVLLKVVAPAVPDFYQGTELWSLTLVDPDNRGRVDFRRRARLLERAERAATFDPRDETTKMAVIARALRVRRDDPDLFARGRWVPLVADGLRAGQAVAVAREHEGRWAVAIAPRFLAAVTGARLPGRATWRDTAVTLPRGAPRRWRDALSGRTAETPGGRLALDRTLAALPLALLRPSD